jgi:6-pyruvoyltetrahydropterin/6-carboxytetrahydropterin synthase
MYIVSVDSKFASAHYLRGYEGDCARVHGHTWKVTVDISVEDLDDAGISIDFKEVSGVLEEITAKFDHRNLNEIDEFLTENPTAENIARTIYLSMFDHFKDKNVKIDSVTVAESEKYRIKFKP